jgi:hypothetical protein
MRSNNSQSFPLPTKGDSLLTIAVVRFWNDSDCKQRASARQLRPPKHSHFWLRSLPSLFCPSPPLVGVQHAAPSFFALRTTSRGLFLSSLTCCQLKRGDNSVRRSSRAPDFVAKHPCFFICRELQKWYPLFLVLQRQEENTSLSTPGYPLISPSPYQPL